MAYDPYKSGQFKKSPYYRKSDIEAKLVVTLTTTFETRGLQLIAQPSRCICTNSIHELIMTDEAGKGPGATVDRIAYVGFMDIKQGGVITVGDAVIVDGQCIGHIAGFDETHMPNHYNIVLYAPERKTGEDLDFFPGANVVIRQVKA